VFHSSGASGSQQRGPTVTDSRPLEPAGERRPPDTGVVASDECLTVGMVTVNVLPTPAADVTLMLPPV
jgi:hypothetical protein